LLVSIATQPNGGRDIGRRSCVSAPGEPFERSFGSLSQPDNMAQVSRTNCPIALKGTGFGTYFQQLTGATDMEPLVHC